MPPVWSTSCRHVLFKTKTEQFNPLHEGEQNMPPPNVILRRKQVEHRTGLSRSTIYLFIDEGTFPRPVQLGERSVGWLEHEIDEWILSRIEKRDQGQA